MINGLHTLPYKIRPVALFAATAISFYALSLLWFAYCFVNGSIDREMFFNSDALFIPSLFKNLFTEGKHFSDWLLPPSSFIFPDALLYGIAYILSKNAFTQILILAILQSVAFFFLVSALLSHFFRRLEAIAYSALISANIILLGLYFSDPFGLSFLSSHHFGSLLSLLMLSILLLKFTSASTSKIKFRIGILSVFVTALSAISDRLILLHFIAPALLIGIFFSYTGTRQKEILKFGFSLVAGLVLAFVLEKIYISRIAQLGVGFGSLFDKSMLLANWALAEPWLIQLTILSLPISLLSALLFLRKSNKSIDELSVQKSTLALLILVSTLFALFVTGLSSRDFTPRYLLPYLFLSPIFLFLFLSEKTHKFLAVLLFFSCLAGFFITPSKEKMSGQFYDTYPEFVKCVDTLAQKHAVTRGVAQFWDAFPLYVFSSNGLSVAPVIDDVSPMKWIYNASDLGLK